MASITVKVLNPETGVTGDLDVNRLGEALSAGAQLAQSLALYNPETGQSGEVAPDRATAALQAGALPVGSHQHQLATTGKLESFGRGALQGATLGFSDEIAGGLESLAGSLGLTKQNKSYQQARDESRAANAVAAEANPITSKMGEFTGGLATALLPGLGSVGVASKGAGLGGSVLASAKLGATLGGLDAAGKSTAENLGDVAVDAGKGALMGGAVGGVGHLVGKGVSFAAHKGNELLSNSVNPHVQRLLALGATGKDFANKALRGKLLRDSDELDKLGIFGREGGSLPDVAAMADRVNGAQDRVLGRMREVLSKNADVLSADPTWKVPLSASLQEGAQEVLGRSAPTAEQGIKNELNAVLERLEAAGGLADLVALKRAMGGAAKWDATQPAPINAIRQKISNVLNEHILELTPEMGALNSQYGALATAEKFLGKQLGNAAASSNVLGMKMGDNALGGIAGTMGAAFGGAPGAAIGYGAATLGNAALRSTEGRLMRAEVGADLGAGIASAKQMLGMRIKSAADQQALQMAPGLIPRTIDGVKKFAQQAMQTGYANIPPQLQPMFQRLNMEPPGVAEITIRGLMPMLTGMMTPSVYPSELEGRVMEPQDKLKIAKQIRELPGLTPSQRAAKLSKLTKTGYIDPEVYLPQKAQDMEDRMNDFTANLERMGY